MDPLVRPRVRLLPSGSKLDGSARGRRGADWRRARRASRRLPRSFLDSGGDGHDARRVLTLFRGYGAALFEPGGGAFPHAARHSPTWCLIRRPQS